MRLISLLGSEEFYMLVMPALYWCIDSALGLRVGIILLLSNGLTMIEKLVFHTPRPYWIDSRVHAYASEPTFSLPSGHAQNAVSVLGLIAAKVRNKAVTIGCIALILLIGISRIYLGVHFAGDVILGWLMGLILLIVFLALEPAVTRWISGDPCAVCSSFVPEVPAAALCARRGQRSARFLASSPGLG